jgi:hypothetical protein
MTPGLDSYRVTLTNVLAAKEIEIQAEDEWHARRKAILQNVATPENQVMWVKECVKVIDNPYFTKEPPGAQFL